MGKVMTVSVLRQAESGFLADMLYEAIFIPEGHGPLPNEVINIETIDTYVNRSNH